MASETFQLAILLSVKDLASGQMEAFTARARRATELVKKDLQAFDKNTREQAEAIQKNLSRQLSGADGLSKRFAGIDKLRDGGRQKLEKDTRTMADGVRAQVTELDKLSEKFKAQGKLEEAGRVSGLAEQSRTEADRLESVAKKLHQVNLLREAGRVANTKEKAAEYNAKADEWANKAKEELGTLDKLKDKLKEISELRSAGDDSQIDALKEQIKGYEALSDSIEGLKEKLAHSLGLAGTGVAGLAVLYQGAQVAANFQASMTDLRATLAQSNPDGSLNLAALNSDMAQAKKLAVELGNSLPGTTAQFATMIAVLKQNGLDAQTIFKGAGKAVAELAVANNAVPEAIAKDFARFGQMFELKPEEYTKAADLFSRIYTATGIESGELMEAMKQFQGRAGAGLGLTGLAGAETATRMIAFLAQQGVGEGSEGGTAAFNFFKNLATQEKKLKALEKKKGIKLELFDEKGKFKGVDNAIAEMQKLRSLSQKELIEYGTAIAGDEGAAVLQAFTRKGAEGWAAYNEKVNDTIDAQSKLGMKSKDFNNKLESLQGTWENLKVTVFEPLLPPLTSLADKANTVVGSLQQFGDTHPTLLKTTAYVVAFGAAGLTAYGSIKTLSDGVRLWRTVTTIGASQQAFLSFLNQSGTAATAASTQMATATTRAAGLRGALTAITPYLGVTVALLGVGYAIQKIDDLKNEVAEVEERSKKTRETVDAYVNKQYKGKSIPQEVYASRANIALRLLNKEGTLAVWANAAPRDSNRLNTALNRNPNEPGFEAGIMAGFSKNWTFAAQLLGFASDRYPFQRTTDQGRIDLIRQRAPQLADPNVMAQARHQMTQTGFSSEGRGYMEAWLKAAFKDSFAQSEGATKALDAAAQNLAQQTQIQLQQQQARQTSEFLTQAQQGFSGLLQPLLTTQQGLLGLPQPLTQTQQSFQQLPQPVDQTRQAFAELGPAASGATSALNNLTTQMTNWQPPASQVQTLPVPMSNGAPSGISNSFFVPSKAAGGRVLRGGLVEIHQGEDIVPADVAARWEGIAPELLRDATRHERQKGDAGANVTLHYAPTITVNGGSNVEARQTFREQLSAHAEHIERMLARAIARGRERA